MTSQNLCDESILSKVETNPDSKITFLYFEKLKPDHEEELVITNPTERIVAFKLDISTEKLKLIPFSGYIKPDAKMTILVKLVGDCSKKVPENSTITISLLLTTTLLPPNPIVFWSTQRSVKPFQRKIAVEFVQDETPFSPRSTDPDKRWVDLVKRVAKEGEEEEDSSEEDDSTLPARHHKQPTLKTAKFSTFTKAQKCDNEKTVNDVPVANDQPDPTKRSVRIRHTKKSKKGRTKRNSKKNTDKRKSEKGTKRKLENDKTKRKSEKEKTKRKSEKDKTKRKSERDKTKRKSEKDKTKRKSEKDKTKRKSEKGKTKRKSEKGKTNRKSEKDKTKRKSEKEKTNRKSEKDKTKRKSEKDKTKRKSEKDRTKRKSEKDRTKRKSEKDRTKRKSKKKD